MNSARARIVPPHSELAAVLARAIVAGHGAALPDLSRIIVLLPAAGAAPALRRCLSAAAGTALLGPQILSLQQFAQTCGEGPLPVPPAECRLILVEALRKYRNLFPGQDPWQLAEALYALFEELNLNAVSLPEQEEAFAGNLATAYAARPIAALSREAQIVHLLWRAFLEETGGRSPAAAYAAALRSAFAGLHADESLYLAGFDGLAGAEHAALAALPAGRHCELWLQGRGEGRDGAALQAFCARLGGTPEPLPETTDDARARFLDAALSTAARGPAPADPGLRITRAEGPEHEARCVELAVREALLDGCGSVAVVTEDRRLARRLRALLERAEIELQDQGGWALSTSAAAAALNAWLDSFERRFQFRPLLALLKSGFFAADPALLRTLERDLVYGAGLESGLDRYQAQAAAHPGLQALLQRLEQAARSLPAPGRARPLRDWMAGVERSLHTLQLWDRFRQDEAGRRLIEILRELDAAFARRPQIADWREFRTLLDRAVERATFVPPQGGRDRRVRLLTLEQSALLQCDAVILAGATRNHIPGAPPGEPFFNQSVRGELGLPTVAQRHALGLARLRRVLHAAPRVRITYASEQPGEPAQLSPWIEALESYAAAAGIDLRDPALAARAGTPAVEIAVTAALPAVARRRPAPSAPAEQLPRRLSATAHQRLVDCPYRYFAAGCLGLRAEQAPDEDPDRSDYGLRVHRILEAFTQQVRGLPEPFDEAVTPASRDRAQARLEEIAAAVFAPDLRERALAHVWVTEFDGIVPMLLDWLMQRQARQVRAEVPYQRPFGEHASLFGTADRVEVERDGDGLQLRLVDYKTGRAPGRPEVEAGEEVQLLHYALLDERAISVEYLPLREDQKPLRIDEPELGELRQAVGGRLDRMLRALDAGAPMPALGDAACCSRCEFAGLCRRGDWHEHE
ncbi:MAG: PD-(D/E)XK nuclease family protein [Nevskia sp.]|nr:PD-(D/E)XK nuclease family protein [Nevskia sp.]